MGIEDEKIDISIHALRGEGDEPVKGVGAIPLTFQSTPSVGRATRLTFARTATATFQSTPSVGRATR